MPNNSRIHLTDDQIDRLVDALHEDKADVDELLAEGERDESDTLPLSDDDAVGYALDMLPHDERERVDAVLASSPEAAREMAWMKQAASAWQGPEGEARVRAVARSIVWRAMPVTVALERLRGAAAAGFGRFASIMQAHLPLQEAVGAPRTVAEGETDDGLIRWEIVRGEERSTLTVRLSTLAIALRGATVRLSAGTWQVQCVLTAIGPAEVGTETTISAEQRSAFVAAPPVTVEIVSTLPDREP